MPIVFDEAAKQIYVEDSIGQLDYLASVPDPLRPAMFYRMRSMYELGQQHKAAQIRKVLGV